MRFAVAKRPLNIKFPLGGLSREFAYNQQPPYFTPDCSNVRPYDVAKGRSRGGSRPGVDLAFYEQITGASAKVRMLDKVVIADSSGYRQFYDAFDGNTLADSWAAASWLSGAPAILPDNISNVSTTNADVGAVLSALAIDTSSQYEVAIWISPYNDQHNGLYQIFGNMNDTTPDATEDGWIAELVMADGLGTYSGTLKTYDGGTLQNTYNFAAGGSPLGFNGTGWFRVLVNSTTVTVKWLDNEEVAARDIGGDLGASAGDRIGFGMEATVAGGICLVGGFRTTYYDTANREEPRELLVASAGGEIWYENVTGMSQLSTSLTVASDHRLQGVDALQALYIADWCASEGTGTNGVTSGYTLDSATYADWTTTDINANDYVAVLSGGTGSLTAGTYTIASVAAGAITLDDAPGNATGVTFRIERAPKVYDPVGGTLALLTATAAKGQVPSGCRYIAYYRGRICLAGAFSNPHVCYQSRVDDFNDWLYTDTDVEGAVATTGSDGTRGQIGDSFTALIAIKDDMLVYGCRNSIWVQSGDIRLGGEINNITHDYGMLPNAWCYMPNGGLAFMSQDGLYYWRPGSGGPENISEDRLPQALKDIDTNTYNVCMEYDHRDGGLHIYLSAETSNDRDHWWFEWENKGFWPVQLQDNDEPFAICRYNGFLVPHNTVLLGGRNGYLRMYSDDFETDGTATISSHIEFGPFRPGNDFLDGRLDEVVISLAVDSGDVDWAVRVSDTMEGAVESTTDFDTGTASAGFNYKARPRARGGAFIVRYDGAGTQAWALERLSLVVTPTGAQRKA